MWHDEAMMLPVRGSSAAQELEHVEDAGGA